MTPDLDASAVIVHAIQLSIAPVFLLAGIAGLLNVMAGRLARVIDRARSFEARWPTLGDEARERVTQELSKLEKRRHACSWAINFCTAGALVVCIVVVTLFVQEYFSRDMRVLAGTLFVVAMLCLICGLSCFMREVYLATHSIALDPQQFDD